MRVMELTSQKLPARAASRHWSAGFSLLELMIVIVIIGILVSVFTLSIGSFDDNEAGEHTRRLEALLELGLEEATMQGMEVGLRFYQHGYEFSARKQEQDNEGRWYWRWLPLEDDQLLKPREFGEEYAIELLIEGKEVDLDYDRDDDEDEYLPQIYLFSSGDLAPEFQIRIRPSFSNEAIVMNVDVDGTTEVIFDDF